ncbi:MAG: hypothetical protein LIO71_07715 [Ruminococcus sp.]|nr:hypothetical protein [Ruminococcus sp.]
MAEEVKETQVEENPPVEEVPKARTYSEEEYNALKTQLESLQQSTKDNEDFKAKWEQSEKARKDFEHKTLVSAYVRGLNLKDDIYEKYITDELISKGLKFENGKLIGGDDVISAFKETHPDAFKPSPSERVASPTSENAPKTLSGVEQAFLKRNPNLKF